MKPLFITVYTDASHCPNTLAGGWGIWLKFAGESLERSGGWPEIKNSNIAEYKAAGNGLYYAKQVADTQTHPEIIIVLVTDCKDVQDTFNHMVYGGEPKKENDVISWFADFLTTLPTNIKIRVKKVKAHSNKDGKRSWVNNRVDKLAKVQMRKLREKHKDETGFKKD